MKNSSLVSLKLYRNVLYFFKVDPSSICSCIIKLTENRSRDEKRFSVISIFIDHR